MQPERRLRDVGAEKGLPWLACFLAAAAVPCRRIKATKQRKDGTIPSCVMLELSVSCLGVFALKERRRHSFDDEMKKRLMMGT